MGSAHYWQQTTRERISRRRAIAATVSTAAAAAFLAACGGGKDGGSSSDESGNVAKPVDTTKQAKRGGSLQWFTTSESASLDISTANLSNNDKSLLAYNVLLQVKPGYLQSSEPPPADQRCQGVTRRRYYSSRRRQPRNL